MAVELSFSAPAAAWRSAFANDLPRPDHRRPERVAGTARIDGLPPTEYTHSCQPPAWAAASRPLLAARMAERPLPR